MYVFLYLYIYLKFSYISCGINYSGLNGIYDVTGRVLYIFLIEAWLHFQTISNNKSEMIHFVLLCSWFIKLAGSYQAERVLEYKTKFVLDSLIEYASLISNVFPYSFTAVLLLAVSSEPICTRVIYPRLMELNSCLLSATGALILGLVPEIVPLCDKIAQLLKRLDIIANILFRLIQFG